MKGILFVVAVLVLVPSILTGALEFSDKTSMIVVIVILFGSVILSSLKGR